jgi:PEGA domain
MGIKRRIFIGILFFAFGAGFCGQKAKVLTATGKKWDVVFIRMHNDTIYLQVPKVNGKPMSVNGHKTKFKKIEFSDGTTLDLSLSNYPPEHEVKSNGDIGDWPGPSLSYTEPQTAPPPSESTASKKSTFVEDSVALNALAAYAEKESRPDSSAGKKTSADSIGQTNIQGKSDIAGGTIVLSTKPSLASITLDGNSMEETTPFTLKHVAPGRHSLRVAKDSLSAFTVITVKEHKTANISLRLKKEGVEKTPVPVKRKNHTLAWSLCLSSAVLLAGSAASYYVALDDQKKALDAKDFLDKSLVPGKSYEQNLEINRQKSDDARSKIRISDILLGIGALDLGLGVVFFF